MDTLSLALLRKSKVLENSGVVGLKNFDNLECFSDTLFLASLRNMNETIKGYKKAGVGGSISTFNALPYTNIENLVVGIDAVQSGTGDPSPDNIRPISGWDAVNVTRCGKNLLDVPQSATVESLTFTRDSDGYVSASSSTDTRLWGYSSAQYSVYLKSGAYKFVVQVKTASSSGASGYEIYNPSGTKIAGSQGGKMQTDDVVSFTASADGIYRIMIKQMNGIARFMIITASETDTNYESYVGQTYPTTLPQTVYGGTLDVVNGVLTITHGYVDLGTLTWSRLTTNTEGLYRFGSGGISSLVKRPASLAVVANIICSALPSISGDKPVQNVDGVAVHTNGNVLVYSSVYATMTAEEVKTAMSGVQLVYELATSQTIQLTPQTIKALSGINNLWCNTGDIISFNYYGV